MIHLALLAFACSSPDIRVTAIEYGRSEKFPSVQLVRDAPKDETRPLSWQVWLVRTADRTILVDTGFQDPERAKAWGVTGFQPVGALVDVPVTDVVITHGHWDHVGGIDQFPDATVWIEAAELRWMESRVTAAAPESSGVLWTDLESLHHHAHLKVVTGDAEVAPGVTMHRGGGHTPGVAWVEVGSSPPVVLTSDIAYLSENLERNVAPGGSMNPAADLEAYAAMKRISGARFVPGHDPATVATGKRVEIVP